MFQERLYWGFSLFLYIYSYRSLKDERLSRFTCGTCSKTFSRKFNRDRHVKTCKQFLKSSQTCCGKCRKQLSTYVTRKYVNGWTQRKGTRLRWLTNRSSASDTLLGEFNPGYKTKYNQPCDQRRSAGNKICVLWWQEVLNQKSISI